MQIEEHLKLSRLFDLYGKLLSEKQQLVMDKYLNLDIGESEIAEMSGESRQSIHDAISKAKKQLILMEEKCEVLKNNIMIEQDLYKVKSLLLDDKNKDAIEIIDGIIKLF